MARVRADRDESATFASSVREATRRLGALECPVCQLGDGITSILLTPID